MGFWGLGFRVWGLVQRLGLWCLGIRRDLILKGTIPGSCGSNGQKAINWIYSGALAVTSKGASKPLYDYRRQKGAVIVKGLLGNLDSKP